MAAARCAAMLGALLLFAAGARADNPCPPTKDFDLTHVRTHLSFHPEQKEVIGQVTETFTAVRSGAAQLRVDFAELAVSRVTVNGAPAKFSTTSSALLVTLARASRRGETRNRGKLAREE